MIIMSNTLNISGTAKVSVTEIAPQSSQSSMGTPIFPIAVMGSGVVIGLMVVVIIILAIFLHHFKRKAGKLAEEKQGVHMHHC